MYTEAAQLEEPPEIPLFIDIMGGVALVAAIGSEVASRPATRRLLRGVAVVTGLPFIYKMNEYNDHFKTDLFGLNIGKVK